MKQRAFLAATCALCLVVPAGATALVDTGSPDPATGTHWALALDQSLAVQFSLGQASTVDAVQGFIKGGSEAITIKVLSDARDLPGATLFSGVFSGRGPAYAWQGLSGLDWRLGSGTYWLGFETAGRGVSMSGDAPRSLRNEAFTFKGAFAPAALGLGVRVSGVSVAAVPEPASWAMLLVGFGCVGGALRYRSRAVRPGIALG